MGYVNNFSVYEYFMICHSVLNKLKLGRYFSSDKKNLTTILATMLLLSLKVLGRNCRYQCGAVCLEGTHKAAGPIMMTGGAGVFLWAHVLHLKMGSPKFFFSKKKRFGVWSGT